MRERDVTTAYVASVCWVLSHLGDAPAELMRAEAIREALGGGPDAVEEWNAGCGELAEYARRQGEDRRAAQFDGLKLP